MKSRDLIELLLLAAIWGGSFLFMRVASPEFGPVPLIEIRVAIAAAFLLVVLAWRGGLSGLRGKTVPLTFLGAVNSALPFSLFAYATLHVTAGFAAVLNASSPLFTALVAYLWFRERLTRSRVLGLGIGFLGVLVLVWGKISFHGDSSGWAVVAALTASLAYGVSANYTKRHLTGADPIATATGSQIAAAAALLPLASLQWPEVTPSVASWLSAVALGIACTGIAYILYFRLIAHVGPTRAIAVTYLIPLFGMVWGLFFLHEAITPNMIAGCAVILLGTALATGALAFGVRRPAVEEASSGRAGELR
ncbi:MAG: DMT family transporter [Vicinamibacteria bacterium]